MIQPPIAIQGIPYDDSSSFAKGPAVGPDAIRKAFLSPSSNTFSESGIDLFQHPSVDDLGNLELSDKPVQEIENQTAGHLQRFDKILTLGGDHFITFPILKAFTEKYGKLTLVQLDAHPDLYDELDGNRHSHACPFARSHEAGLINRHIQIGIRTMNQHQQEQADRFGVEVLPINEQPKPLKLEGPVYITLDLDVMDPAFVPGVSHYEPGGLSVRETLNWIKGLRGNDIVGADIVELNPSRDIQDMTAMVAGKFFKEILELML